MSRWAGSKVRLHQPRGWAEGGMTASWHFRDIARSRMDFRFGCKSSRVADIVRGPNLMLWTAPTLRHQGAIGWLHRNEPVEGSRPLARLARSVSISRSRFFKFAT